MRTSFFGSASGLVDNEATATNPLGTPLAENNVDIATSSAINVETSTTSSTIPIVEPSATPNSTLTAVSIANSYLFASPLSAATGNVEKIRITTFILDGTGAGVSGKTVSLTGVDKLAVSTIQAVTDTTGKAIFDVAAGTSGTYIIGASIGGTPLSQTVSVKFD